MNIFKLIVRNFIHRPVINLINLLGLAISLAFVITMLAYSYSEITTDSFNKNGDRVYLTASSGGEIFTPGILKDHIELKIPSVESIVRIQGTLNDPVFQTQNGEPFISDLIFADEDFFRLFTYKPIEGDLESALRSPFNVIITRTLSEKLFGPGPSVGKIFKLNNDRDLTVAAVIEEPPVNSSLSFSAVTSVETKKIVQSQEGEFTNWGSMNFQTFMLLKEGSDPMVTWKLIESLIPENNREFLSDHALMPLKKIYFARINLLGLNFFKLGDKNQVIILVVVALFILLVALINFMNISTSQWLEQKRYSGILKVYGATSAVIFRNVVAGAFLMFLAALIIAVEVVNALYPSLRNFTGINFNQEFTHSPGFILASLAITIVISLFLSILPALRISSLKAIDDLNKTVEKRQSGFSLSGAMVTFQFAISILLISFTLLIQKQVKFACSSLAFNKTNIIGIKLTQQLDQKKEVLKEVLMKRSAVAGVSFTQYFPGKSISQAWGLKIKSKGEEKEISFSLFNADASFFKMMGLQLVKGRYYSGDIVEDKGALIVNERFLSENKIEDPIGLKIPGRNGTEGEIVGVIKDFYFRSVSNPLTALVIRNDSRSSYCMVNLNTSGDKSFDSMLGQIKSIVSELSPSFPVEISFLDQATENMYQSELRFRRIFSLFALAAIVICCLGILAMSMFACQRRIKEIGIRKVNGAKIGEILILLNMDFIKWVAVAFLIASPVAFYMMKKWLLSYAYKTELSWWIFFLGGIFATGIALLTVSWQSWRAATRNPVEALRYE